MSCAHATRFPILGVLGFLVGFGEMDYYYSGRGLRKLGWCLTIVQSDDPKLAKGWWQREREAG